MFYFLVNGGYLHEAWLKFEIMKSEHEKLSLGAKGSDSRLL